MLSYSRLLAESSLIPSETLFVDDSIQNIIAAQEIGINTVYLTNEVDITDIFQDGKFNQTFLFKQSKSLD